MNFQVFDLSFSELNELDDLVKIIDNLTNGQSVLSSLKTAFEIDREEDPSLEAWFVQRARDLRFKRAKLRELEIEVNNERMQNIAELLKQGLISKAEFQRQWLNDPRKALDTI